MVVSLEHCKFLLLVKEKGWTIHHLGTIIHPFASLCTLQGLGKSTTSTAIESVKYLEDAVLLVQCSGANAESINSVLERNLSDGVELVMQQLRAMHGFPVDDVKSAPAPPKGTSSIWSRTLIRDAFAQAFRCTPFRTYFVLTCIVDEDHVYVDFKQRGLYTWAKGSDANEVLLSAQRCSVPGVYVCCDALSPQVSSRTC